jgi:transposase-like protein
MPKQAMRRTIEEKNVIIKQWRESGKSLYVWCGENNFPESTLYNWVRPRKTKNNLRLHRKAFTELKTPSTGTGLKIKCAELYICLSKNFDALELKRCLQILRGSVC